ncbi:MAG: glutathione S-transferase family protein [Candidatus Binatia bacterium]
MSQPYRLFGVELSPYSLKVRAYFRYKNIPHQWVARDSTNQEEFERYAKLPLVPLVVTPDGKGMQDSTPIIEHFERLYPEPSIHPSDPALAFLSALIEEYGDEWGNKQMFHYRWTYEADQKSTAERIARLTRPGLSEEEYAQAAEQIRTRMVPRLSFVGSSEHTKEHIESSFERLLAILERHLRQRKYLFGGKPAFGDFGLAAQLHQCSTDPSAGALMRTRAPRVRSWSVQMLDPQDEGKWETWDALAPTLRPLLREIAQTFLPWTVANAKAVAVGEETCSVMLRGKPYAQGTQKYHARSFGVLRERYAQVSNRPALDAILAEADCLRWLQ